MSIAIWCNRLLFHVIFNEVLTKSLIEVLHTMNNTRVNVMNIMSMRGGKKREKKQTDGDLQIDENFHSRAFSDF